MLMVWRIRSRKIEVSNNQIAQISSIKWLVNYHDSNIQTVLKEVGISQSIVSNPNSSDFPINLF